VPNGLLALIAIGFGQLLIADFALGIHVVSHYF
jgi:hypothetical protein